MRFFPLAFALMLCVASSAFAIVAPIHGKDKSVPVPMPAGNPVFTCTPAGFTLTKDDSGFHLHGTLQVPTSGWSYDLDEQVPGPDGSMHGALHMKKPDGIAAQVISAVTIDHVFSGEGDRLTVEVDGMKSDAIECKMAGMTQ